MRSRLLVLLGALSMVLLGTGVASAQGEDRAAFVAQSRAAGLDAAQAAGLQNKVDRYLVELAGQGTQVSPNQIDLGGAVLNVTVPGEDTPRPIGEVSTFEYNALECVGYADPQWFCAYELQHRTGDNIGMWKCDFYSIPWYTVGSWENNQTSGTRSRAYFTDQSSWLMPAAYSIQTTNVAWTPVARIRNC